MEGGDEKYVTPRIAAEHFGVTVQTLRMWEEKGFIKSIRTKGIRGHRRYSIKSFKNPATEISASKEKEVIIQSETKCLAQQSVPQSAPLMEVPLTDSVVPLRAPSEVPLSQHTVREMNKTVCYCRVSSEKQVQELKRQKERLQVAYPGCNIIEDIGSGINLKARTGLLSLLEKTIRGEINEVVVTNKDRLCRFGADIFFWLFSIYKVKITVLEERSSTEEELTDDIVALLNLFTTKKFSSHE
jgi:predicted site-specific integrase-resolvase